MPQPLSKQRTIILHEGDPNLRAHLSRALKQRGYRVISCKNCRETLDSLASELVEEQDLEEEILISDVSRTQPQEARTIAKIAESNILRKVVSFTSETQAALQSSLRQVGVTCYAAPLTLGVILSCLETLF